LALGSYRKQCIPADSGANTRLSGTVMGWLPDIVGHRLAGIDTGAFDSTPCRTMYRSLWVSNRSTSQHSGFIGPGVRT
jgi:hypothetical protein